MQNHVVENVEFKDDDLRMEADVVVITTKGTFIIDEYNGADICSNVEMLKAETAIEDARSCETYLIKDADIGLLKIDFATLIATLEEAAQGKEVQEAIEVVAETPEGRKEGRMSRSKSHSGLADIFHRLFMPQNAGYAGTAAVAALIMVTMLITVKHK